MKSLLAENPSISRGQHLFQYLFYLITSNLICDGKQNNFVCVCLFKTEAVWFWSCQYMCWIESNRLRLFMNRHFDRCPISVSTRNFQTSPEIITKRAFPLDFSTFQHVTAISAKCLWQIYLTTDNVHAVGLFVKSSQWVQSQTCSAINEHWSNILQTHQMLDSHLSHDMSF